MVELSLVLQQCPGEVQVQHPKKPDPSKYQWLKYPKLHYLKLPKNLENSVPIKFISQMTFQMPASSLH